MNNFFEDIVNTTKVIQEDNNRIEELKKKRVEDRLSQWKENLEHAYELAYQEITKNAKERIKECAENGFDRCDLYTFYHNQQVRFNGFYLINLLRKGMGTQFDLMKRLQEEFKPFNVYMFSLRRNQYKKNPKYVVRVSWKSNQ